MRNVYIFRHGETDWNTVLKFQGHTDIPLNNKGLKDAEGLIPVFQDVKIDYILSSDLKRAAKTCQIAFSDRQSEIIYSDQLREAHLGILEGQRKPEIIERYGMAEYDRWRQPLSDFGLAGSESKHRALKRIQKFINEFLKEHDDALNIAVSTHGFVMHELQGDVGKLPMEKICIKNCQAVLVTVDLTTPTPTWHFEKFLN